MCHWESAVQRGKGQQSRPLQGGLLVRAASLAEVGMLAWGGGTGRKWA